MRPHVRCAASKDRRTSAWPRPLPRCTQTSGCLPSGRPLSFAKEGDRRSPRQRSTHKGWRQSANRASRVATGAAPTATRAHSFAAGTYPSARACVSAHVSKAGGLDSILGAALGGLIIGLLENLSDGLCKSYLDLSGVKEVAPYVILVVILMIKPYGLFGTKEIERV